MTTTANTMTSHYQNTNSDTKATPHHELAFQSFELLPNCEKRGAQRILRFMGLVVFPIILTHILFTQTFEMSQTAYLLAQLPVLLVLLNIFYFLSKAKGGQEPLSLQLEMGEICLMKGEQVLSRHSLEGLQVEQVGWGIESDSLLPALRIQGENFPRITIGTTCTDSPWTDLKHSVEFTDYCLHPRESWEQLKGLLKKGN